jgi:GT2 family glycosyltransferase
MPPSAQTDWPGAIWIGEIDRAALIPGERVTLDGGAAYRRARLLVRDGRRTCGFVDVEVSEAGIATDDVLAAGLTAGPTSQEAGALPPISVVLCTRDRPVLLRAALRSLATLDYSDYEVVVVDNDPRVDTTRAVVAEFAAADHATGRFRIVDAPIQGLARARNVGVLAAAHDLIAFTDDDVLIDRAWLRGLAAGFATDPRVGCVTGLVASGEIDSLSQWYFDRRVTWARNCAARTFSLRTPPPGDRMFPFQAGNYGTGANFALRKSVLLGLGGFDERFGAGSATGGGEDIDVFVRVLLGGADLRYEPDALVWHRHRSDLASLGDQSFAYGRGLGAWLTKIATDPRTAFRLAGRVVAGLRHLRAINELTPDGTVLDVEEQQTLQRLGAIERRGVLSGPWALVRARLAGGRARPLRAARPLAMDGGG